MKPTVEDEIRTAMTLALGSESYHESVFCFICATKIAARVAYNLLSTCEEARITLIREHRSMAQECVRLRERLRAALADGQAKG